MDYIIDAKSLHKCAYDECRCQIPSVQKYCSDYCANAASVQEIELECECHHAPCVLE